MNFEVTVEITRDMVLIPFVKIWTLFQKISLLKEVDEFLIYLRSSSNLACLRLFLRKAEVVGGARNPRPKSRVGSAPLTRNPHPAARTWRVGVTRWVRVDRL